ncbi:MAG: metalloregulator ArsR/SmtB family transcription factor [Alphaproteobacteria bacterium]
MNIEIEQMRVAAAQAADLMQTLSNPNRLMLLCLLVEGEASVGALAEKLELRQTSASQQLALLRKDGLVQTRRDGQTIYYRLNGEEARRVIEVLYDLYC